MELGWIFDADGSAGPVAAADTVDLAVEQRPAGVVAVGLGGPERDAPRAAFATPFRRARAAGLHSVPHAGETVGPDEVRAAVRELGAERIGHGLGAARDPWLLENLAARGVTLEVCPTSNVRTGAMAVLASHPLPRLLAASVPVTLGTDDPGLFDTDLDAEYPAGLRPSPTRHAVVGFLFSSRLTQGPAVRVADRHHPLRLDMLTMTRSACVQVRCAVIALWCGHHARYAHQIEPASTKLDSILPTSPAQDFQSRSGTLPGTGGPFGAAPVAGAPYPPGVAGQVGAQPSPDLRIMAFAQVDGPGRSGPAVAHPMGRPMVSAGDEVSASLLAGSATAGDVGLCRQAGCSPSAAEGSPPRVAHGHDIDNILSIGVPQASSV